jgi:hypothetical protein
MHNSEAGAGDAGLAHYYLRSIQAIAHAWHEPDAEPRHD